VKVLVTGACGFVGSTLIRHWTQAGRHQLIGLDNLSRPGSELNRTQLRKLGVAVHHGDLRSPSDLDSLPSVDVVVDAAANPSTLAGIDGRVSSRQLVEHNLIGTINLLEYCQRHRAVLVMLSTSRVYSIRALADLPMRIAGDRFEPVLSTPRPGVSPRGVDESFSTLPPVSLYGATKIASERLALEYGEAFQFPVWVNRCGVLAGAGQFGRPDQGIYAYWVNAWLQRRALRYIGFGGHGYQVRDCLHPADLARLIDRQIEAGEGGDRPRVVNVGGGASSARSLRQLSAWCLERIGDHVVSADDTGRPFDVSWLVLDATRAREVWQWMPVVGPDDILAEILEHARVHPDWLDLSRPS
jgi:CDP-paratose 2-epimerase